MKVVVTVDGFDVLRRKLKTLEDAAAVDTLEKAVLAGAKIIQEDASRRAPKRTGKLSRSIEIEVRDKTRNAVSVDVGPRREAFYGKFVEMGHALVRGRRKAEKRIIGYVSPKPFLRPAFDSNITAVRRTIANALKAALGRVAR